MPSVLVAEDEPFLGEIIRLNLADHDVKSTVVGDGAEVIRSIDEAPPKLLLLDLLMPRVDGFAVLRHIREKGYDFPVVVLSNVGDQQEEERCRAWGAREVIVKSSIDDGDLWKHIEHYFHS